MRNLTLFSTWYTSLHVCVALAHDPRYVPRLVLAAQFLPAVGCALLTSCRSALLTSCRSALLSPAVGPLFPFFSVSTASTATSLTSTCLSTCSSLFHNCFSRQLSVSVTSLATRHRFLENLQRDIAFSSSSLAVIIALHEPPAIALHGSPASLHATLVSDELFARPRADPRDLFRTLLHVLRVMWWSPSTTLSPSARCACRRRCLQSSAALARHADVAIHLRSALAEGLSVDAIVFRVHFRSASKLQSRRT